ncbi:MAG: SGNH/GDSL hydrolase family protein [Pyrinomonadaceae bacterium]
MAVIALLGDSVFDNKVYVGSDRDVSAHLRTIVPADWTVNLLAVDGSMTQTVVNQAERITSDTTHLVVSVGGNDALSNADILNMPASNAAEVLNEITRRSSEFDRIYQQMLDGILSHQLPMAICTIYYPNFLDSRMQNIASAALANFNDVIVREAVRHGLPIIDLRLVCAEPSDYANEIEPSGAGGRKIANAIFKLISEHDFSKKRTEVYY